MRNATFVFVIVSVAHTVVPVASAAERDLGVVALHQALLDLGTDLRLMCVAAHPDDEDGATLTYYRKKYGLKTFVVMATRGEGGQNEIGSELYEELGVLRTHEMAAASAITGAELHFLNLPEFGYSKSAEETFDIWGKDVAFERLVRKIRELRPDVIITHHGPGGGHGHHQAIGRALQRAFDAADDPAVFPEHLKEGLELWQPARLYVRSFGGSGQTVVTRISELEPVRGMTYAEIAAQALGEHKTQGMDFFVERFLSSRSTTSYGLAKESTRDANGVGRVPAPPGGLLDGLYDRVSAEARTLSQKGLSNPNLKAEALRHLKGRQSDSTDSPADKRALSRANELARVVCELRLNAQVSDPVVVYSQMVDITAEVADYGENDGTTIDFSTVIKGMGAHSEDKSDIAFDDLRMAAQRIRLFNDEYEPTIPHAEHLFDPGFLEPQTTLLAKVDVDGVPIVLRQPLYVDIAPSMSLEFLRAPYLLRANADKTLRLELLVTNYQPGPNEATIEISGPDGFQLDRTEIDVRFEAEGGQKVIPVNVTVPGHLRAGDHRFTAHAKFRDDTETTQTVLARAVDLKLPEDIRVGVIQSYDDTFVTTLEKLRVPHETLGLTDYTQERLDQFTTILVDIRAYLERPDLVANNQALLDYVHRGGTVVVMYQKTFEWQSEYAPYPLRLSRNRVTVEDAPIEILEPGHPLFNVPNEIVAGDWTGWRQERGLYFPSQWDDRYTPLVDVADPGEDPPPGSVLITQYGEGTYMYTALGWYRQLREVHPGTLRIFANMLAL